MALKTSKPMLFVVVLIMSFNTRGDERLLSSSEIEVEDGDTLLIQFKNEVKRIQLAGIDAPENSENPKFKVDKQRTGLDYNSLMSLGIISAEYLRKQIAGGEHFKLHFQLDSLDRYGRIVGELYTEEGRSLNRQMVKDGYAIPVKSQSSGTLMEYVELQRLSQKERAGLWGLLPKPTSLWADLLETR
ncbi:MAG: thermonuclease family protein [Candidatus Thiodiazotropha sp. (ex Codakia rugifera)]|nr:thermonuclease family protein [Candidatus Thiodiazotropha sp. (ex Codakia rugifera)]